MLEGDRAGFGSEELGIWIWIWILNLGQARVPDEFGVLFDFFFSTFLAS